MRSHFTSVAILAFAASAAAQATRWVSPTGSDANPGTQALPLQTIYQANFLSTAGDTIRLLPGTYGDEQGVIVLGDKDIQVIGSGVGSTVIRAHSTLTANVPTGMPNAPVATQQRPVILVQGSANVDLRGFTVDGNFAMPANGRLTGIYYRDGADGVVADIEIKNCQAGPLDGSQGPAGVVVRGDGSGDTCEVTLHNVHVHRFGKVGVAAFFDANVVVESCRVVGADHVQAPGPAQNGIQFGYGAEGFVRRSHVADLYYDPASYVAAGILAYDAGDLIVEDNSLSNCEHGIYYFGNTSTTNNGSIRRNRVVAGNAGVYLDNCSGLQVVDNHLQLSLDLFANAGFSNVAGNTWADNCYSSYGGIGSYAIPGGGGNVDLTPRRGVDLFTAPVTAALPAGHVGRQLVVAQLNGAGGSDFATLEENAGLSLSVGLNTGGSFTVVNQAVAPSGRAIGLVAAELDGTAGLDLAALIQVTTPSAGARLYTFKNNGSGVFTPLGTQFLAGTQASALAAGDVNGDGKADLAVANVGSFGGGDAILLANQGPTYGTSFAVSLVPGFGSYTAAVRGVAFADINGDLTQDLLVTEGNQTFGRLHVFYNNGSGSFAAAGYSPLYVQNDPTAVGARDLDGDGDQDVLVTTGTAVNSTPGGVTVLENTGGGTWRRSSYAADYSTNALALGDIDDDGLPGVAHGDAAIVNTDGGTLTVLGAFQKGAGFGHGGIAANGTMPTSAAFGDLDGDAFGDLFYTNGLGGQVVVLPGKPSARADYYGVGIEGYRARVPYIGPIGAPGVATQPNLTLGLELTNGREFTLGAFIGTYTPSTPTNPWYLWVDPATTILTYFAVTDGNGRFPMLFTLPATPDVHGLEVFYQAGVLDTVGAYPAYPGVALSQGLRLRIGY
jgi:hypothetical protein